MSFFVPSSRGHSVSSSTPYSRSKSDSNVRSASYARTSPMFAWSKPSRGAASSASGGSYYKRRPRDGFIARMVDKIKRAIRQLIRYVRRHPFKALVPVIMALVSSGALAAFARSTGVPLPRTLLQLIGAGNSVKGGYDAWYGSQDMGHSDSGGLLKGVMKAASAFV